jgi:dolichol kinase
MLLGLAFLAILHFAGRKPLEIMLFAGILAGFLAVHLAMRRAQLPLVDWFLERFERVGVRIPGFGSAWYALGALLATIAIHDVSLLSAAICTLAFGDSLSTLIGIRGSHKIPYNPKKTLEGSAAFILGSFSAYVFIGPVAIPLSIICAVVESMPLPVDDNLTIPATAILFFSAIGMA